MRNLHFQSLCHAGMAQPARILRTTLAALLACWLSSGCAALTNPIADAIPVRLVPQDILGDERKDDTIPIDPSLLRQDQPDEYKLDAKDILGIYLEGVLGEKGQPLPITLPGLDNLGGPPAVGYPVSVQENGTIDLPFVPPIKVKGMTIPEAKEAIHKIYIASEIVKPERERLIVSLARKRTYRVTVMRRNRAGSAPAAAVWLESR